MKILLVNDNPVVSKLVTLSAQKTSDQLSVVNSIDEIKIGEYDLLMLDDALYDQESLQEIKSKINFQKSLFIHSRNGAIAEGFSAMLNKPFLPTDLVELFSSFSRQLKSKASKKEISEIHLDNDFNLKQEPDNLKDEDDLVFNDDVELYEDLSLDGNLELDEDFKLENNLEKLHGDLSLEDDLLMDEEATLLGNHLSLEDEDFDSVLDKDELQEVQDLLDETEDEFNDDLSMDKELTMDDDMEEELLTDMNPLSDADIENDEIQEIDLETQIKNAVENLSDEDLNSELDAQTLLGIAQSSIKDISGLNSRDLKLAIGEEVDDLPLEFEALEEDSMKESFTEDISEELEPIMEENGESFGRDNAATKSGKNEGVEALKKLLKALSNEDIAASLQGMTISINITLGDK